MKPEQIADDGDLLTRLYRAAIGCKHSIDADTIVLHRDDRQPGHNALAQLADRLYAVTAHLRATPQTPNLACASVQMRLATQWGYVKAAPQPATHQQSLQVAPSQPAEPVAQECRTDGRCQYAIDRGAEDLRYCPKGKCCMPIAQAEQPSPIAVDWLDSMPPLPLPNQHGGTYEGAAFLYYTIDQMREYGRLFRTSDRDAIRDAAFEQAAVAAWSHYMDACRKSRINPAEAQQWLSAAAIRALKSAGKEQP